MIRRFSAILLFSALVFPRAASQDPEKRFSAGGYLSAMQSVMFDSLSGPFITDNLIHNRINLKAWLDNHITFAAEFRNRVFTGDMLEINPDFAAATGSDQGVIDMSWNLVNEQSVLLNTTVDRLWADFNYGKFQARIGRQRINWGQTMVWNPNDIFNAYSYFDFDYVERPGSDAIRLQYYPGFSSALELAVKADNEDNVTAALLYRFNKWGYDIQFLGGYSESEDYVLGAGWSGALGSVSFRGEFSWFQPAENISGTSGTGIITTGIDKVFGNNSTVQAQVMYCNNPTDPAGFGSIYYGNISTKELAFSEFSAFGSFSWPVTPLFTLGVSGMWFPDLDGFFAGSSADFSVAENVDLSVLWQYFRTEDNSVETRLNLGFLRFKVSF